MKTERRHELQTNTLADYLGKWIVAVKPYANVIIIAVLAVLVVMVSWQVLASRSQAGRGKAWGEFEVARRQLMLAANAAGTGEESKDDPALNSAITAVGLVIQDHADKPVAHWAQFVLGSHYQTQGTRQLFYNRDDARATLKKAADYFRDATETDEIDLKQRAYFGLGQALECQGELDKAIEAYDALADGWPEGPYAASAKEFSERLKKPATREFYTTYEAQSPNDERKKEEDRPIGGVLNPDSFKIPGVDNFSDPSDPLDPGAFIPKVPIDDPDDTGESTEDPLPDEPDDAGTLPGEPSREDALPDEPVEDEPAKAPQE
ncbi:MAG: tetratricopeptide repeat protein [Pirellulales bacterium]|nr:tetratricopeptide repeat protein [Pirellulales bacterium]